MDAIVSGPGEGVRLARAERELLVKAGRPELSVFEFTVDPGYEGPGPHVHREHVDSFYVLEGELEFRIGDRTVRAPAGTLVVVPPRVAHAFTNAGPGPARFLNVHAPGGFEQYLRRVDELGRRGEEPGRELHERYDVHDVG